MHRLLKEDSGREVRGLLQKCWTSGDMSVSRAFWISPHKQGGQFECFWMRPPLSTMAKKFTLDNLGIVFDMKRHDEHGELLLLTCRRHPRFVDRIVAPSQREEARYLARQICRVTWKCSARLWPLVALAHFSAVLVIRLSFFWHSFPLLTSL